MDTATVLAIWLIAGFIAMAIIGIVDARLDDAEANVRAHERDGHHAIGNRHRR
jgi:hypothetical protein